MNKDEQYEQLNVFIGGMIDAAQGEEALHHLATRLHILSKLALLRSVDNLTDREQGMSLYRLKYEALLDGVDKVMGTIESNKMKAKEKVDG